jgi:acyl dehydratase
MRHRLALGLSLAAAFALPALAIGAIVAVPKAIALAKLKGVNEVPSIITNGSGDFRAKIFADHVDFTLSFSGLTGDYNVLHTDAEFMKQSIFGERIAHGLLCLAIQSGLFNRAASEYATLGLAGLRWKFKAPVKIGDTIRLRAKVAAKKDLDKPDRGLVTIERTIVNQRDEVVQQGETDLIVEKRR